MSDGSQGTQDTNSSDVTIQNPQGLLNAYERQKQANHDLKAKLEALQNQVSMITSQVGGQSNGSFSAQLEQLKQVSEQIELAKSEVRSQYEPQIQQLTQSNQQLSKTVAKQLEAQALQSLFAKNNGDQFSDFYPLASTRFKPVFKDIDDPILGKRKEVVRFTKLDGTPFVDDKGVELEPKDILAKANRGEYGSALSHTFKDYNAANGDGFSNGGRGGYNAKNNPWATGNLTEQTKVYKKNPGLAKQLREAAKK